MLSLYWDPRLLSIVFLASLVLYVTSRTPKKWMMLALPFALYKIVEAVIVGMSLTDPRYFRTIPPELAGTVVFRVGPIELRYGGLLWTISDVLKLTTTMMITFVFIYTTSLNSLLYTLVALGVPRKLGFVVTVALRFVPELVRELKQISVAWSLKGWSLREKNVLRVVRMSAPIVNPFTRRVIDYVDRVSLSAVIRGFGAKSTVARRRLELSRGDYVTLVLSTLVLSLAVYAYVCYGIGAL